MNNRSWKILVVSLLVTTVFSATGASAQTIAFDMRDSMSQNLISFANPDGVFTSPGDGFQKYQRGVSASIPFSILDDSLSIFPTDALGIIDEFNTNTFFGVTDTVNGDTSGDPVSATWVFNIAGATDLAVSMDMGAMGDFETNDTFTWTYSIDGGPTMTAFDGLVDDSIDNTYMLAGGAVITLNDPMTVQGAILNNTLQTFSALISGTGSELTLTLTASTDGGSEAFAFQNIEINEGGLPLNILAFDLVESANQNLTNFDNPFTDAFSSAGDGFQKYQRFVSASIPFSVLDDSLLTFPGDSLGIVDDNNTNAFFGVTDTVNGDTSGPVSATWTFDIAGGENIGLLIDMGAMGDFEAADTFIWTYSIDSGPPLVAFESSVDEAASNTYTLAGGAAFTLSDPMTMQGSVLTNVLTRYSTAITGNGNQLVLTLTAETNGGTEAFAFQNIIVVEDFQPDEPPPPTVAEIFEIQGNGTASPFDGDVVESLDNIVTALAPNGFFMQTPQARSDGDPDTSDGIFVFTGSAPGVAVGDQVDVVGTIDEFFGFTEFDNDSVVTGEAPANPVPAAVVFDSSRPSNDPLAPSCAIEFECYEGMLVQITNGTVTGPNQRFGTDPLAEVHITAADSRTFREPGIEFPGLGMPPIPTWDGNPEVFELDPDKLGLSNLTIPAGSHFDAVGVIGFEFGGYELWPSELIVREAVIPAAVRKRNRAEFTVGSLNVFRLFDDVDDPEDFTSQGRSRDDAVVSTAEYQTRQEKFAAYIVDVLDAPDILAIQEAEKLGVLEDLAGFIAARDATLSYSAFLEEGNDVGTIDVGFLVRDTVTVDAISQLGKDEILAFDGSLLNDRPPLLLEGRSTGDGANFPIAVIVVHNRSLSGIDSATNGPRVRQKRFEQAQSLAAKIQDIQAANPDVRLVVTGDFNAFEFTDGFVDVVGHIKGDFVADENLLSGPDLVDPNLINQSAWVPQEQRYSFIFRGSAQILDHSLTSMALDMSIRGLQYGRGNADAAAILIEDASIPLRSSDHDGLVLYLTRDKDDDGVFDSADQCPGTMIPETPPTRGLGVNRWALIDDDFAFDTVTRGRNGPAREFTTGDTGGCSCEQIIEARNLGKGHSKFGCSTGVMNSWINSISP